MSMSAEQVKKAQRLVADGKVHKLGELEYQVDGRGDTYIVKLHDHGRAKSCTCPAGSHWRKSSLYQTGKHVCYHIGAVMMARKSEMGVCAR